MAFFLLGAVRVVPGRAPRPGQDVQEFFTDKKIVITLV
jgi:hypothetical protein